MASIKKYGNSWRVQYRDPQGTSRTKSGFRTKTAAQAWADKTAVSILNGEWTNPQKARATPNQLWDTWIPSQHHLAPSSKLSLESSWRTHVQPIWGEVPISKITPTAVQDWVNTLHKENRSPSVIHRAYGLLSNLMELAVRDQRITLNPCREVQLPPKRGKKMYVLTPGQLQQLIMTAKRYKSLLVFLGYTGARWGEAVALRVEDVDVMRKRAVISKAAPTVGGRVIEGETKTRHSRVIGLPEIVVDALRDELEGKSPGALVWSNVKGEVVTTPSRRSWWGAAVRECMDRDGDFPCISLHDLRHTAASILISQGASVLVVQRQLGHASAKMTLDKYAHLFDSDLDSVVTSVSNVVEMSWNELKSGG